ncbi:MAG: type II toxin-antitoxin system RelE/ParE family toxin [Ignavibacteria bacterium]|nr:type II toxin-antitoxin system RelE/ParE family toxin [Ignavibacteria bacterium]
MVKKITFSPEANEKLKDIILYLVNEWSVKSAVKFIKILEDKLNHIEQFPLLYPVFNVESDIHFCVINKQITRYYRITDLNIEIITLFDSRSNPTSIKL